MSSSETQIAFKVPFDDEDADLIIRSNDEVHFRVYKTILHKASPVFSDMFAMPPGADEKVQIVSLTEDGETIEQLLRLCYPTYDFYQKTLDKISALMGACDKYQMDFAATRLARTSVANFVLSEPLRVYVLACRAHADQEARRAAYYCLSKPIGDLIVTQIPDFRYISANAYRSLLNYYHSCRQATASVLSCWKFPWADSNFCWFQCTNCAHDRNVQSGKEMAVYATSKWWTYKMGFVSTYLLHQAPPLFHTFSNLKIFQTELDCNYCKPRSASDMHRFIFQLEKEIGRVVNGIPFELEY